VRIGALAAAAGTTARAVRYYEELGLLSAGARSDGGHREYTDDDLERLHELLRLKGLLGLSLEELREVMAGEDARARRRDSWPSITDPADRARMLQEAAAYTERLLELVRRRKAALDAFEDELDQRLRRIAELNS
jgi:MerR family transcriptional regulator, repressor of the yfmOP operon